MSSKLLVIISTGEREKATTGLMFALRTMGEGWMDQVKVFLLGPSEALMARDTELQNLASQMAEVEQPVACRFIAERDGIAAVLAECGLEIDYVGKRINDLIKEGYTPMVF